MAEVQNRRLLAEGASAVTEAVEGLFGLKFQQFKQLSMLAQGEFSQFLTAPSKERTRIFRSIFRTRLYELMQKELGVRARELKRKLADCALRREEAVGRIKTEDTELKALLAAEHKDHGAVLAGLEKELSALEEKQEVLSGEASRTQKKREEAVSRLEAAKKTGEKRKQLAVLKEEIKALEEGAGEREEIRQKIERSRKAQVLKPLYDSLLREKRQLSLAEQELEKDRKELSGRQELYLAALEERKQLQAGQEALQELQRKHLIGILAEELVEGEPCPVCGSVHHPVSLEKERADRSRGAVGSEAPADGGQTKAPEGKTEIPKDFESALKAAEKQVQAAREQENKAHAAAASLLGAIEKQEKLAAQQREGLKSREEQFSGALSEGGFSAKADFRAALMEERQRKRLEAELSGQERALLEKQAMGRQLEKELSGLEQEDLALLSAQAEEWNRKLKELRGQQELLAARLDIGKDSRERLLKYKKEEEALREQYSLVGDVEQAVSGANPKRLVFEQYVLSVYFEEILYSANGRLGRLCDGRYLLRRSEEVRDGRTKEGMELLVFDAYTGKERSVKTLSGGESFKAALALALGMADVIQSYAGGIQVETLFIDEGFGSLDSESMDQAVEVLRSLSGGNRLVGIISHVEELKERLERQIVVEKTNIGSKIRISVLQ